MKEDSSRKFGFKEHCVRLFLDKTLYKAFIRLQADKGLGRAYAGLLPFVEGLHSLGYLSKDDYDKYVRKYSEELKEEPSVTVEANPARLENQQSKVSVKKHIDYSKFSDGELLEAYRRAWLSNNVVEPQLIQGEAMRRGYRFKADDNGNIRIIALDKTLAPLKVGRGEAV